jgi:hypothetical protein
MHTTEFVSVGRSCQKFPIYGPLSVGFDYWANFEDEKMCKIVLNGLSSEMDLAEIGFIGQVFIKS